MARETADAFAVASMRRARCSNFQVPFLTVGSRD